MRVVLEEVSSCLLFGCGLSSSVIKNTRFDAVLGALETVRQASRRGGRNLRNPSRITQLQLVNTSPMGIFFPWTGGKVFRSRSGSSLASRKRITQQIDIAKKIICTTNQVNELMYRRCTDGCNLLVNESVFLDLGSMTFDLVGSRLDQIPRRVVEHLHRKRCKNTSLC